MWLARETILWKSIFEVFKAISILFEVVRDLGANKNTYRSINNRGKEPHYDNWSRDALLNKKNTLTCLIRYESQFLRNRLDAFIIVVCNQIRCVYKKGRVELHISNSTLCQSLHKNKPFHLNAQTICVISSHTFRYPRRPKLFLVISLCTRNPMTVMKPCSLVCVRIIDTTSPPWTI